MRRRSLVSPATEWASGVTVAGADVPIMASRFFSAVKAGLGEKSLRTQPEVAEGVGLVGARVDQLVEVGALDAGWRSARARCARCRARPSARRQAGGRRWGPRTTCRSRPRSPRSPCRATRARRAAARWPCARGTGSARPCTGVCCRGPCRPSGRRAPMRELGVHERRADDLDLGQRRVGLHLLVQLLAPGAQVGGPVRVAADVVLVGPLDRLDATVGQQLGLERLQARVHAAAVRGARERHHEVEPHAGPHRRAHVVVDGVVPAGVGGGKQRGADVAGTQLADQPEHPVPVAVRPAQVVRVGDDADGVVQRARARRRDLRVSAVDVGAGHQACDEREQCRQACACADHVQSKHRQPRASP